MEITITSELKSKYPGFSAFGLDVKGLDSSKHPALKKEKAELESKIRREMKDARDRESVKAYTGYFSKFSKTYPILIQVSSILEGKPFPDNNPASDILFMTEIENLSLMSVHDTASLGKNLVFDLSREGESFVKINGRGQDLKAGDIILRDGSRIIASMAYGPDSSTKATGATTSCLYLAWLFDGRMEDPIATTLEKYIGAATKGDARTAIIKPKEGKFIVTPWEVKGNIDYDKLSREFGTKPIDDKLLARIRKDAGGDHHFLRRKVFYSHMYLDEVLADHEKGKPFYLYTGRAPSGPVHLGHLIPWIFTRWLQERFGAKLLFQIPDEEKYLFKDNLTLEDTKRWAHENILDIIAVGFDPEKTMIFLDTEYAGHMYKHACMVGKKITFSTIKSTFGFTNDRNIGEIFYTAMQSVPALLPTVMEGKPTRVLIPCAIDQDVHFRLTRDVADSLGYYKPATILSRFLPGLEGMAEQGKMSSSIESTAIFTTDDPKTVKKKILKYAFSGGRDTIEEHRRLGGVPEIDVAYQWLTFFEEDDGKLQSIYEDYRSGKLLSGELKLILVDKINHFLSLHQRRREEAKKSIERFMLRD